MNTIRDFLVAALPWVAIGVFVAVSAVQMRADKNNKASAPLLQYLCWAPLAAFLFVAVMEYADGNTSSGTTWLVLAVFGIVLNIGKSKRSGE